MKYIILFILSLSLMGPLKAQLNVVLLHQLVEDNKNEYDRQVKAKERQGINSILEEANKTTMSNVKDGYRRVQERFAKLNIIFDAAGVALNATPIIESIIDNQEQILYYCEIDPSLLPIAIQSETFFVQKSTSLFNYLVALSASIGDVNQMKASERRLLFQHVIDELHDINHTTLGVSRALNSSIQAKIGIDPFDGYIDDDRDIVEDILEGLIILK